MGEPTDQLSEEDREALIQDFEMTGGAVFRIGEDEDLFEVLQAYIRRYGIATQTDVDTADGTITITKRPWGSFELP